MRLEPLALRHRDIRRLIDRGGIDARRRWRNGLAHQRFADELAAQRGDPDCWFANSDSNAALLEDAGPRAVRRQRSASVNVVEVSPVVIETVELGEIRVHARPWWS